MAKQMLKINYSFIDTSPSAGSSWKEEKVKVTSCTEKKRERRFKLKALFSHGKRNKILANRRKKTLFSYLLLFPAIFPKQFIFLPNVTAFEYFEYFHVLLERALMMPSSYVDEI